MKIYHYTNINSLALILKNRTFRFSRLDMVDDLEECAVDSHGIQFAKNLFVSCWTEKSDESIPMWKMYGGDVGGIRISMEKEMFEEYEIRQKDFPFGAIREGKSLIPLEKMLSKDYFILPISRTGYLDGAFYRAVEYVDYLNDRVNDAVEFLNVKRIDDKYSFDSVIDTKRFGAYKHKRWQFQEVLYPHLIGLFSLKVKIVFLNF